VTDPADLDLRTAAELIASGELSALEITSACIARAEKLEPEIKAFVTFDPEGALAQARSLSNEVSRSGVRGPLHGIPVGIKDLIDVAGMPTTAGSRILAANRASEDAPVVAALRSAGAVIMGKTNTHEFAFGVVSLPTRNPWDAKRIPGGSSGGSAAAVAGGMCLGALGTDTAGSIRIPAALCGISGLTPRAGSVPGEGIVPLAPRLDSCGPLARTAADAQIVFEALTGPIGRPAPAPLTVALPRSLENTTGAAAEVVASVREASRALGASGARLTEVELPRFSDWDRARAVPLLREALEVHRRRGWYPQRAADYSEETLDSLRYAEALSPERIEVAERRLSELVGAMLAAFDSADVLVLPAAPRVAPTAAEAVRPPGGQEPLVKSFTRVSGPVNICGLAAAAVPCGSSAGLPLGLQLVARDEITALGAALAYQKVTSWHELQPP
jgi:aspartyl-tRNA(Asn)/glutamyl-tRNA(Gln) amidotransferase subunit A